MRKLAVLLLLAACSQPAPVVVSPPVVDVPDRLLQCPTARPVIPDSVANQSEFAELAIRGFAWGDGCAANLESVRRILRGGK